MKQKMRLKSHFSGWKTGTSKISTLRDWWWDWLYWFSVSTWTASVQWSPQVCMSQSCFRQVTLKGLHKTEWAGNGSKADIGRRWWASNIQTLQRGQAHLLSVGSTVRLRAGWTTDLMQQLMFTFLKVLLHTIPRQFPVSVHTVMEQIPILALRLRCKNPCSPIATVPKASTAYSIHVSPVAAQLAGWPGRHTKYKPPQGPQHSQREKETDPADVLSHTCVLSLPSPLTDLAEQRSAPNRQTLERRSQLSPPRRSLHFSGVWWAYV